MYLTSHDIPFWEIRFTKYSIRQSPEKQKALQKMEQAKRMEDVVSFLQCNKRIQSLYHYFENIHKMFEICKRKFFCFNRQTNIKQNLLPSRNILVNRQLF